MFTETYYSIPAFSENCGFIDHLSIAAFDPKRSSDRPERRTVTWRTGRGQARANESMLGGLQHEYSYMDAPGLPSFQFMTAGREDCTRTSGLSMRHGRCPWWDLLVGSSIALSHSRCCGHSGLRQPRS